MNKNQYILILFIIFSAIIILQNGCSFIPQAQNKYAVVYGISKYIDSQEEGETPNLTYTDDDAIEVAKTLGEKGFNVILRTNQEATRVNLESDIKSLNTKLTANDIFLFYYSGHGTQYNPSTPNPEPEGRDDAAEYILLYGSIYLFDNKIYFDSSKTYYDDTLANLLNTIETEKRIVILDACNSGGFIGDGLEYDLTRQDYNLQKPSSLSDLFFMSTRETIPIRLSAIDMYNSFYSKSPADITPYNALVISAAGEQEYSWESSTFGHGVMTFFLLKSMKTQYTDLNNDGYITTMEIFFYTKAQIDEYWNASSPEDAFFSPHISGGPIDFVLFKTPTD